ncbi:MAG: hypothetical protein LBT14_04910 [Treponema sp.]|jgi:hypothetical protein|nr:hypothetical protein [Treponema sp.]
MVKDWLEVPGVKATAWKVPAGEVSALGSLSAAAQAALETAQSSEGTPVITALTLTTLSKR